MRTLLLTVVVVVIFVVGGCSTKKDDHKTMSTEEISKGRADTAVNVTTSLQQMKGKIEQLARRAERLHKDGTYFQMPKLPEVVRPDADTFNAFKYSLDAVRSNLHDNLAGSCQVTRDYNLTASALGAFASASNVYVSFDHANWNGKAGTDAADWECP